MHHDKRESGARWALGGRLPESWASCAQTTAAAPTRHTGLPAGQLSYESNGSTQPTSVWNGTRPQRL